MQVYDAHHVSSPQWALQGCLECVARRRKVALLLSVDSTQKIVVSPVLRPEQPGMTHLGEQCVQPCMVAPVIRPERGEYGSVAKMTPHQKRDGRERNPAEGRSCPQLEKAQAQGRDDQDQSAARAIHAGAVSEPGDTRKLAGPAMRLTT